MIWTLDWPLHSLNLSLKHWDGRRMDVRLGERDPSELGTWVLRARIPSLSCSLVCCLLESYLADGRVVKGRDTWDSLVAACHPLICSMFFSQCPLRCRSGWVEEGRVGESMSLVSVSQRPWILESDPNRATSGPAQCGLLNPGPLTYWASALLLSYTPMSQFTFCFDIRFHWFVLNSCSSPGS